MNPYDQKPQPGGASSATATAAAPPPLPLGFANNNVPGANVYFAPPDFNAVAGFNNAPYPPPPPPYHVASSGGASAGTSALGVQQQQQQQHQQQQPIYRSLEEHFQALVQKYEIGHDFANRLQMLTGFKIVFIFDDSSSMNSLLGDSPLLKHQKQVTRWDELEYFGTIAIELANLFDHSGCDVYFLNKQPPFRQFKPRGYTPLARALDQVLRDNLSLVNNERKLLIVIVTDGEPTDEHGNSDVAAFKQCLQSRKPADRIFTTVVACTDQDDSMDYLNRLDRKLKHLDVVDDFRNEKREVLKKRGVAFPFSYGDYVVKALIGSVDKSIDQFDEKKEKGNSLFKKLFH